MIVKSILVFLIFLLPLFMNGCGGGGSTSYLSWVAPTEREDGSPIVLSAIAGYRIYYGVVTGTYNGQIDINDHTATQAQLSGVLSGNFFL